MKEPQITFYSIASKKGDGNWQLLNLNLATDQLPQAKITAIVLYHNHQRLF